MDNANFTLRNVSVVTQDEVLNNCSVVCSAGKIERVVLAGEPHVPQKSSSIVDGQGMFLAPGFIDLHIHGSYDKLVDRGRGDLEQLCRILPRYGVTGFLPTVTPFAEEEKDIALLNELARITVQGSAVLGFFLEGHFLALTGAISHIPANRSVKRIKCLMEAMQPYKAVFGISPELESIANLIPHMVDGGYHPFITHTMADVEQTKAAIQAGARHATHFYDVFPYPGEKEGGV